LGIRKDALPSCRAIDEARRLAGPSATVESVVRLVGGQHAATWRVTTADPALTVVIREFPPGDQAGGAEQRVLGALGGLEGLAPVLLAAPDPQTLIISHLDGEADIRPADPVAWATQLGQALATVHAAFVDGLPSLFDAPALLEGPAADRVRAAWPQILAAEEVLTHRDYWSGNVVWRDGTLTGVVDWEGAARGPRGFDVGWCRLDLVLLYDEEIADIFLAGYEEASGHRFDDIALWDAWSVARSHRNVMTWVPNYGPLGRADLDVRELRRRHAGWTDRSLGGSDRTP
jgi:hypothetical protein